MSFEGVPSGLEGFYLDNLSIDGLKVYGSDRVIG